MVRTGSSSLVANGIRHAIRNVDATLANIVLVTNDRFASFIAEAGRAATLDAPFVPPSASDIERLRAVSEAYGYRIASPDGSAAVTG